MPIHYHSTRGNAPELDFRGVTMAGLASDGGLYIPKTWPQFSEADIMAMRDLSYLAIATQVMLPFVTPSLDEQTLRRLLNNSYTAFDDAAITPLRCFDENHWLLELFHGPTLAFKDVALQFLGHLYEHFLHESGEKITVIGATSGDTGSAAIAALAHRKNIECIILYPHGRPSDIQRKQMTCVDAPNVHTLAIDGSFDDCQAIVKALFNDAPFRKQHNLAAVNSINWARILAQMVYYFVAAVRLGAPEKAVSFVVPTGNFGNVYAAYAASKCGLPIAKLGVASNSNDILTRFFASGIMETSAVSATLSPSMDIQISSNFERLLYDLCQHDPASVRDKMQQLATEGCFKITPEQLDHVRHLFVGESTNDEQTIETIKSAYELTDIVLDPHTAVGVYAAMKLGNELPPPVVMLGCAHPAKFPDVIQKAIGLSPTPPTKLATLLALPEQITRIPNDLKMVREYISSITSKSKESA